MANTANITCRAVAATVAAQSVRLNTEKIEIGCCRVLQNPAEVRALDPTSSVSSEAPGPHGLPELRSQIRIWGQRYKEDQTWSNKHIFGKPLESLWKVFGKFEKSEAFETVEVSLSILCLKPSARGTPWEGGQHLKRRWLDDFGFNEVKTQVTQDCKNGKHEPQNCVDILLYYIYYYDKTWRIWRIWRCHWSQMI